VSRTRLVALSAFALLVLVGTVTDLPRTAGPRNPSLLAADFHVHAAPGDGLLPVWEIQREAGRRGLDVVAITNHNHRLAIRIARGLRLVGDYPIVIDGQELTAPDFHMAAIGAERVVDPWLTAVDAIAEIQRTGGVAIAAHPGGDSWRVTSTDAFLALDGVEVAHPGIFDDPESHADIRRFFERVRQLNPDVAAIGSSDFHFGGPLGVCRTHVSVEDASDGGVLRAIKRGLTTAECAAPRYFGYGVSTWLAAAAIIALSAAVLAR
jgi:predicted metal-dependent phosphoesterase TrpH